MKILSIDTSTKYSVVAVSDGARLLAGSRRLFEKGRSEGLSELITACLKKAKTSLAAIDYFGVGVGPGSFTGLRIGISTVKALSYCLKKPCLPFLSLDAIAFNSVRHRCGRLCVMVDARRSSVYCRFYKWQKHQFVGSSKERRIAVDFLKNSLKRATEYSGDGLAVYKELLAPELGSGLVWPQSSWYPTPQSICALVQESLKAGKQKNCFELSAVYLYPRDCQVSRKKG